MTSTTSSTVNNDTEMVTKSTPTLEEKTTEQISSETEQSAKLLLNLGKKLNKENKLEEAVEIFSKALQIM